MVSTRHAAAREYADRPTAEKGPAGRVDWDLFEEQVRDVYQHTLGEESSADAVHDALYEVITSGLLPPGSHLREEHLARIFQVSRTPIREALMRLESEQLLARDRRRGLVVGSISAQQILEVYAIREALDGIAARLAAQFATLADIVEMEEINQLIASALSTGDYRRVARLNVDFHEVISRASRNEMLHLFVQNVHSWVRRMQTTTFSHIGRAPQALSEHQEILVSIRNRDEVSAEESARRHIRHSLEARLAMGARSRR